MTTLSTGVLLKLLDGMKTGSAKPVGEHRTAVLQVTDIVPADLDEKDLWPKHGQFYVKVSDSSHSIYATLPLAQADLVLSNKLHLGQFVHVDRLDPGSPVPVIVGAKPIPGRHPLVVGTPEPAARGKAAAPRRGSWGPENHAAGVLASPRVIKPTTLNFEDRTPVKDRPSAAAPSPARSTASVRKSTSVMPRLTRSRSFVADKGDPPPKILRSPFSAEKSTMSCTASRAMSRRIKEDEPSSPISDDDLDSTATSSKKRPSSSTARVPVPGKLNVLGKEAMEQREQAQKAALEALRNASATENVVRIYKMFSELSKTARPDTPATCFDSFLSFHQEAVQAVTDIESIQAATSMAAAAACDEPEEAQVLQEVAQNRTVVSSSACKRRGLLGLGVSKSVSFAPGTLDPLRHDDGGKGGGRSSNASRKCLAMDKMGGDGLGVSKSVSFAPGTLDPLRHDDGGKGGGRSSNASRKCLAMDKMGGDGVAADDRSRSAAAASTTGAHSALGSSLKLAKQMQAEAGSWFMEFVEAALEIGLKKKKSKASVTGDGRKQNSGGGCCCPQSLMLRVINWVEMEQSGGSRKPGHPRAATVARKLRIKAKNP